MISAVHRPTNRRDVGDDSGGSLVVQHQDSLDSTALVCAQSLFDRFGRNGGSVGNLDPLYFDSVGARGVAKASAEVAVHAAQDLVAGRERVDHAGLPGAGAGARIQDDFTARHLKYLFESVQDFFEQTGELWSPMIDEGLRHRSHNPLWNQRGTGNLQKRAARHRCANAI